MAIINGTPENDTLAGTAGDDEIRGFAGDDTLNGGAGADLLIGDVGDDTYVVDNSGDTVVEASGGGTDTVRTALLSYILAAQVENFTGLGTGSQHALGNSLNNVMVSGLGGGSLDGGTGNDTLVVRGNHTLNGGFGDDTLIFRGTGGVINGDDGYDRVVFNFASTTQNIFLDGDGAGGPGGGIGGVFHDGSVSSVFFGVEAVILTAGSGNDTLRGAWADDTINGGLGDDTIEGGAGKNRLFGGDGNDTISNAGLDGTVDGGAGHDFLTLRFSQNVDLSLTFRPVEGKTYRLADGTSFKNVEDLAFYGGSGNDRLAGSDLDTGYLLLDGGLGDDHLTGNGGDNQLNGSVGTDVLFGGAGDDHLNGGIHDQDIGDRLDGGTGIDTFILHNIAATEASILTVQFGYGSVNNLAGGAMFANMEVMEQLITGAGADELTFNALPEGDHHWDGNRGSDRAIVDLSSQAETMVVSQLAAGLLISVGGGAATLKITSVETFVLTGGSAADHLEGGIRADVFTGGGGNDVFAFGPSSGRDKVLDFTDGQDRIDVSAYGYHSLAELTAAGGSITGSGDTLVTLDGNNNWVRLENFSPANLTAADFIFAV